MPGTIVAYVGEGESYQPLIAKATELATARQSRLIFYDADAASMFANPLPTVWSADGEQEQFGSRLSPEQLEKAGRQELHDRVVAAREAGVEAFGWLPSRRDPKDLAEYATEQEATLIVIPTKLGKHNLKDWIQGKPSGEQIDEETDQPVLEVELEPEHAKA